MDFDYPLTKVQGNLMSAQKLLGMKLADVGPENQEEIGGLIKSFADLLKSLHCNIDTLRKINLFLIINTDLYHVPLVDKDRRFCHLMRAVPLISRFLYFELLINTDLYKCACDMVLSCPEIITVEVLQVITRYLYRCDSSIFIDFFSSLVSSMYHKILQLENDSKPPEVTQTFTKVLQKVIDFSVTHLKCAEDWSILQKQCYFGHFFYMFLKLIEESVKKYTLKPEIQKLDFYDIKVDYDYSEWGPPAAEKNWSLFNINILVFRCRNLSLDISVDSYMAWVEEDIGESNLQMKVREAAFTCLEMLENFERKDDITSIPMLSKTLVTMAIKPRSLDDEIASADLETILTKVSDTSGPQAKWLDALLNYEDALSQQSSVSKLLQVTDVFDIPMLMTFLKQAVGEIKAKSKYANQLRNIIFRIIRKFSSKEQLNIVDMIYEEIGASSVLKAPDFQSNLTETFNKVVLENEKMEELYPDIIILVLQSMKEVIPYIVDECLRSQMRCDLLTSLLTEIKVLTKCPSNDSNGSSLIFTIVLQKFELIRKECPEDRTNFIHMMEKFCFFCVIDGETYLMKHLIPALQNAVTHKKWAEVDLCLDIFSVFVNGKGGEGLGGKIAEVLVFMSHLLHRARLQPPAFTRTSASVCEKAATFVYQLTSLFLASKSSSDSEMTWLRDMGKQCDPLSRFHMRKLWNEDIHDDPNGQLIWATQSLGVQDWNTLPANDRATLVTSLCKVLPLLTGSEWRMIGFELNGAKRSVQCAAVFHAVADALLVLSQLPVLLSNPLCFGVILSNFIGFVKTKVLINMKHMERLACAEIVEKLCILCNELPKAVVKSRTAALVPLMRELLSITVDKSEAGGCSDLIMAISSISEPSLQSSLAQAIITDLC